MWGLHLIPLDTEMASHLQIFLTKDILFPSKVESSTCGVVFIDLLYYEAFQ